MENMLMNITNKTREDYANFDGVCGVNAIFKAAMLPPMGQKKV